MLVDSILNALRIPNIIKKNNSVRKTTADVVKKNSKGVYLQ